MSWLRSLSDRWRTLWAKLSIHRAQTKLSACLASATLDELPELLLRLLSLRVRVDPAFRRNVEGCEVSYVLRTEDRSVLLSAIIGRGDLEVRTGAINNPDVELVFEDNEALERLLCRPGPRPERELVAAIIRDELRYLGNPNYLNKLAYLTRQLIRELQAPAAPARAEIRPAPPAAA
ncbi:hypothetical protein ENSA5_41460 [Enhygromyxa salina]|uniref:SCP2 domain-containing protein n=1 Tax=Enhygromyxa salina TaxID=215803 RepID=A0A2S9XMC3_9BACT|nr:hypothetical protein [Enhygromyxa salina]PRP94034.1 hypothetical protein ENSA5_41460 [Enhygromyxa salina]